MEVVLPARAAPARRPHDDRRWPAVAGAATGSCAGLCPPGACAGERDMGLW